MADPKAETIRQLVETHLKITQVDQLKRERIYKSLPLRIVGELRGREKWELLGQINEKKNKIRGTLIVKDMELIRNLINDPEA